MTERDRTGSGQRVNRGGSYANTAANARSANRNRNAPTNADDNVGLRVSKTSASQIAAAARLAGEARDAVRVMPRS